jgi:hypothetical protein
MTSSATSIIRQLRHRMLELTVGNFDDKNQGSPDVQSVAA